MKTLAPVSALLLSVAFLLAGNGLQGALLPLRAALDEQSAIEIGILGSSYFLGFGAGCYFAAYFIGRVGHIRAFTAAVALASTMALFHALIASPVLWWVLRGITGFCFALIYTVIESWLAARSEEHNRSSIFSVYTIINLTVLTIGQFMLVLGDPAEFPLFIVASILVSLSAIPVALTRSPAPDPPEHAQLRLAFLYRLSPAGMVGAFSVGLANGTFWALGPIYAAEMIELLPDTDAVALFMSAVVLGGAAGQWPLGRWSDRSDRRRVMAATGFGGAAAALLLVFLADPANLSLVLMAGIFGFFAFPLYSLCVAHTHDIIDRSDYVEAASGLLLLFGAGAVAGPVFASALATYAGISAIFGFTAAVHVLLAGFVLYRMRRRTVDEGEGQQSFAESLISAQTVSPIEAVEQAAD